ncbi:hypothetical protein AJ79_03003 [Helicocarpus griseus UAMH5409]|uniref:Enoyl reductase (ER) domain-containing protein n=1 Tax=Helicocarpus griseus UAMH5409 TaxID=1447875 RepID=A0A2B7XZQ7_9EURO|nr:hypothetical protein AJ79_03003 [Helicocarpus griseus UAMH5409]
MDSQITPTPRALVAYGPPTTTPWRLEPISLRPLADTELLIRTVAAGICHTDLAIAEVAGAFGGFPRVMGHEGAGYVLATGTAVTIAKPGDPVLLSYNSCGACRLCTTNHPAHCLRFMEVNFVGSLDFSSSHPMNKENPFAADNPTIRASFFGQSCFASHTIAAQRSVVNMSSLIKSPEELKLFAPLGCGVQTGCAAVTKVADAREGDTVAILGLGGVGLSAVMATRIRGCKTIIGVDRVKGRLELARELGATAVIDTSELVGDVGEALVHAMQALTPDGLGTTVTIETTGVMGLVEAGVAFTAPLGRYVQVGSTGVGAAVSVQLTPLMVSGKRIMGTIEGDAVARDYVPEMVKWYREGRLPLEKIVGWFGAEEAGRALEEMEKGRVVKPVIVW